MLGAVLVLFLSFIVVMPAMAVVDPCENAKNTADEIACAQSRYDVAQDDLNATFESAFEEIEAENQGDFRADQQRWVAYRDAKCDWESHGDEDGEGVQRLHELECRLRETQERIAVFENDEETVEVEETEILSTPRWLNTVSEARRDVFWNVSARMNGYFNCDDVQDYFLEGVSFSDDEALPLVAIVEDTPNGLPRSWVFDLPRSLETLDETEEICGVDWDISSVRIESDEEEVCEFAFQLTNAVCGEYNLQWHNETFNLEHIVEGDAVLAE